MAVSTSHATGKLTASLVVTAACLPQSSAPPNLPLGHSVRRERLPSSPGFTPVSRRVKETSAENGGLGIEPVPVAAGAGSRPQAIARAVESQPEKQSDASSSGTTKPDEPAIGAEGEARSGGGEGGEEQGEQEGSPLLPYCRESTSGQLRGGDLM